MENTYIRKYTTPEPKINSLNSKFLQKNHIKKELCMILLKIFTYSKTLPLHKGTSALQFDLF